MIETSSVSRGERDSKEEGMNTPVICRTMTCYGGLLAIESTIWKVG